MIDWNEHRNKSVEVVFAPREQYMGRLMLPGLAKHAGERLTVRLLWLMGDDDPYPGEWALGSADRDSDVLGRTWIASGDVILADWPSRPA